jgi:hypothetical protein
MTREMIAIEPGEEGEVLFLQLALQVRRRFEVQNARLGRAHNRSLETTAASSRSTSCARHRPDAAGIGHTT